MSNKKLKIDEQLKQEVLKRLYAAKKENYSPSPINSLSLTCIDLMDDPLMISYGFNAVCDMMTHVGYYDILTKGKLL